MPAATAYECLEQIASQVAPLLDMPNWLARVAVDYDREPIDISVASVPDRPWELYDPSLATPLPLPPSLADQVRDLVRTFRDRVDATAAGTGVPSRKVVTLTLTVHPDAVFSFGTTSRDKP